MSGVSLRSRVFEFSLMLVFGLILDSVVRGFQNSELLYTLSNPQKMQYEVSNNYNDIQAIVGVYN